MLCLVTLFTVVGNFCVNKCLQYEKAARATAYYNFELLYTFMFDILVLNSKFSNIEILGLTLVVIANVYMYIVNSF